MGSFSMRASLLFRFPETRRPLASRRQPSHSRRRPPTRLAQPVRTVAPVQLSSADTHRHRHATRQFSIRDGQKHIAERSSKYHLRLAHNLRSPCTPGHHQRHPATGFLPSSNRETPNKILVCRVLVVLRKTPKRIEANQLARMRAFEDFTKCRKSQEGCPLINTAFDDVTW